MLDTPFVKNNKEKVKDNIIKKFQNDKLELVESLNFVDSETFWIVEKNLLAVEFMVEIN